MSTNNIGLAVLERAIQQPDAPAFAMPGRVITYGRAAAVIVNFARRMRKVGVSSESTVALTIDGMPTATIATLAVALLGARWVRASSHAGDVTHAFAEKRALLAGPVSIDGSWYDAPPLGGDVEFPGHGKPGDVWMTAESSGTTGRPKLMPITYDNVWRRVAIPDLQDGTAALTMLNLFPPLSAHGARVNVGNLVAGGTNVSSSPWPELLNLGVDRITGSPTQVLRSVFERTPAPGQRIRSLKIAGSQVTRKFVATALAYFEEIHLAYGATEVGAVTRASITDVDQFDGSVGLPNTGAAFQIIDERGQLLAAGEEGVVRVRTGWMVPEYVGEPELTSANFRSGWFHPGDRGFIDSGGRLHIAGRTNDVINVGGIKLNAADLDEVIQQHPDVADGYCFVHTDANGAAVLSAIVALQPGADLGGIKGLYGMAYAKLGKRSSPHLVFVTDSVPRNENGKPLRTEAAALAPQLTPIALVPPTT